jgi:ribosomal subunit interface protein
MEIRVAGRQVETGAAFREHAETRLNAIAAKYFSRAIQATVTLSPGPHDAGFACDIVMHVMHGLVLKGANRAMEAHPAFDGAADRIEKQLRRYMRRLKDRQGPGAGDVAAAASAGGPDAVGAAFDLAADNANYVVFQPDESEEPGDAPLTIAEGGADIPEASVGDAVMMLDLRNTTALMFRNSKTGVMNMVYRREDGTIGWVEPR